MFFPILIRLLIIMIVPGYTVAAPFDRFVMPGKLAEAHKKYEEQCNKCHEAFNKANQDKLCLDCHKTISSDLTLKKGFHALNPEVNNHECKYCHAEHLGRNADITGFNKSVFDHQWTNFPLKGFHAKIACTDCHTKKNKYRPLKYACNDCHQKHDIHKTALGIKCDDCHSINSWKEAKFDHDKTNYKLRDKHSQVTCNACHPNQHYKPTPQQCYACHRLQDIHQSGYGQKCNNCHSVKDWKKILFNHDKDTKFKLQFGHAEVTCSACHTKNAYQEKIDSKCVSCHLTDDKHAGLFGARCDACHDDNRWSKTHFDHNKDTLFDLSGSHSSLQCIACHVQHTIKQTLEKTCYFCHKKDDAHRGSQGKSCDYCHSQTKWRDKVLFDHDLTKYPLIGLHALVSCEMCHASTQFEIKGTRCHACHSEKDRHKSRLGEDCQRCHSPNGWQQWQFLHNQESDYKLEGAHDKLDCLACHEAKIKQSKNIVVSDKCISCHENDDKHSGRFGKHCNKCHNTTNFSDLSVMQ